MRRKRIKLNLNIKDQFALTFIFVTCTEVFIGLVLIFLFLTKNFLCADDAHRTIIKKNFRPRLAIGITANLHSLSL